MVTAVNIQRDQAANAQFRNDRGQRDNALVDTTQAITDGGSAVTVLERIVETFSSSAQHIASHADPFFAIAHDAHASGVTRLFEAAHHVAHYLSPLSAAIDTYQIYRYSQTPRTSGYKRVTQLALPAVHLASIGVAAGAAIVAPAVAATAGSAYMGLGAVKFGVFVNDKWFGLFREDPVKQS